MSPVRGYGVLMSVELVGALALSCYCAVLIARLLTGGPRHIGGDVVAFAYVLSSLILVAATLSLLMPKARTSAPSWAVHALAVAAVAGWLSLHLSGSIVSHASMFPA